MNRPPDYTAESLAQSLRDAGVRPGDVVFSHNNIGFLGTPAGGRDAQTMCRTVLAAFEMALGPEGTLVLPAFTYSWCKAQAFDPATTPSTCGAFSEFVRQLPGTERSCEPIFSVVARGARAAEACGQVDSECFGERSIWRWLLDQDALFANINLDAGSTFLHFVERRLGVSYRYHKLFAGTRLIEGQWKSGTMLYFCNDLSNPDTTAAFPAYHQACIAAGTLRTVAAGRGNVCAQRAADASRVLEQAYAQNPWVMTAGFAQQRKPRDSQCTQVQLARGERLEPEESQSVWQQKLATIRPDLSGPHAQRLLQAVAADRPHRMLSWETGTREAGDVVPEVWEPMSAALAEVQAQADERQQAASIIDPDRLLVALVPYSASTHSQIQVERKSLIAPADQRLGTQPPADNLIQPGTYRLHGKGWGLVLERDELEPLVGKTLSVSIQTRLVRGQVSALELAETEVANDEGVTLLLPPRPFPNSETIDRAYAALLLAWDRARGRGRSFRLVVAPGVLVQRLWLASLRSAQGSRLYQVEVSEQGTEVSCGRMKLGIETLNSASQLDELLDSLG